MDSLIMTTYKGFNADWSCRDFKYEMGKTYTHDGDVKACASGFHACEYPLDIFNYYAPAGSKFAIVKQSGQISKHDEDSKVASKSITLSAEIDIAGLVKAAVAYTSSKCLPIDPASPASATGTRGAASATGYRGAASATGTRGAASATGYYGAASATGDYGAASATGTRGAASATGTRGAASATGTRGAASATGDRGAASATGVYGAASATGDLGAASATGYQGTASATGYRGAASATGYQGTAMACGYEGRAMGKDGCALFLCERGTDYKIISVWAGIVGKDNIKPDVWYMLRNGKPYEIG